jgi:phospholipid/cholesterol/gamma-HCH transport system substrate-binding protein
MRSRTLREGSVGLLILATLGLLGGILLWMRNFNPANQSYLITIDFTDLRGLADVSGIQVGANVRYRGINVGRVTDSRIRTNGLEVDVEISPATLVIPKDVTVEFSQGGLIGETSIDMVPKQAVPDNLISANPKAGDCDSQTILCDGARVPGQIGTSFRKLVDSSIKFADLFGRQEFFDEVLALTQNTSKASAGVTKLTSEVTGLSKSVKQNLNDLTGSATETANSVNQAATQVGLTAAQVNLLVAENRSGLVNTLNNINQTSLELRDLASGLKPALGADSQLVQNLETLSANAAEASSNLRNLTGAVGSQENVVLLQQTLESARATFQNTQKITADLDELTGDPELRERIRNLIRGLSGLVSSTQQLNQQAQYAQVLTTAQGAQTERPDSQTPDSQTPDSQTIGQPNLSVPQPRQQPEQPRDRPPLLVDSLPLTQPVTQPLLLPTPAPRTAIRPHRLTGLSETRSPFLATPQPSSVPVQLEPIAPESGQSSLLDLDFDR